MKHKNDCDCVNCVAKESPIQEIWIKNATAEEISTIEVLDWLEGYGQVMSLAEQIFIRRYGLILIKLRDDPQWDGTDAAHPAWWRGEKYGAWEATRLIADVLSGKNKCTGRMNEQIEIVRDSVFKLKQERDELKEIAAGAIKEAVDLENRKLKIEEEIEIVRDSVFKLKQVRDELAHNEENLLNLINNLNGSNQRFQKQVEKLTKEWEVAWDRNHDLENESGKYFEQIEQLETKLKDAEERCNALQAKLENAEVMTAYSYYVGTELTCERVPDKYSKWLSERNKSIGQQYKVITTLDNLTCDNCVAMDGKIIRDVAAVFHMCTNDECRCVVEPHLAECGVIKNPKGSSMPDYEFRTEIKKQATDAEN